MTENPVSVNQTAICLVLDVSNFKFTVEAILSPYDRDGVFQFDRVNFSSVFCADFFFL